jgi:hypothetical protein
MMEGIENVQGEGSPGVSLLSTLIVLVTMGALGAVVLTSLPFGDSSSETQTRSVLNELNAPTPAGQAVQGAAAEANMGGSPAVKPPSLPASARTAACRANVGVVNTAVATKHQTDGTYPSSIDELVAGRWLDAAPSTLGYEMSLETAGGQPTGRVLVNGQPGLQGCDAPSGGGK